MTKRTLRSIATERKLMRPSPSNAPALYIHMLGLKCFPCIMSQVSRIGVASSSILTCNSGLIVFLVTHAISENYACLEQESIVCLAAIDCCTSLPFAGDIVSVLSLWYKRSPNSSYKKRRFAAFLRCLRTAAVPTHAKIDPSAFQPTPCVVHVRKNTRPTAS